MSFRLAMRTIAVALLQQAGTLAGDRVESNRATDVDEDEMPFLGVYTGHELKLLDTEGTNTLFDATLTLHVDVRVAHAVMPMCEYMLDVLIGQVQDALLTSPAFWMPQPNGSRLVRKVPKIEIVSAIKQDAEVNYGVGQIAFDIAYNDNYDIEITQALATIGVTIIPNAAPATPAPQGAPVAVNLTLQTPGPSE
jgi:hypothetical protein